MTGTGKRVIEIAEPEHECIDRVLVLLKPGLGDVQLSHAADGAAFGPSAVFSSARRTTSAARRAVFCCSAGGFAASAASFRRPGGVPTVFCPCFGAASCILRCQMVS